jgi:hypothetical protein
VGLGANRKARGVRPRARPEIEAIISILVRLAAALALAGVHALASVVGGLTSALALAGILPFAIVLGDVVAADLCSGVVFIMMGAAGDVSGGAYHESTESGDGDGLLEFRLSHVFFLESRNDEARWKSLVSTSKLLPSLPGSRRTFAVAGTSKANC